MTVEDAAMRWSGLDPAKVHQIAGDVVHVLGVVEANLDKAVALLTEANALADQANKLLADIRAFVPVVAKEIPRVKSMAADIKGQIAAWEAKQRQLNSWR